MQTFSFNDIELVIKGSQEKVEEILLISSDVLKGLKKLEIEGCFVKNLGQMLPIGVCLEEILFKSVSAEGISLSDILTCEISAKRSIYFFETDGECNILDFDIELDGLGRQQIDCLDGINLTVQALIEVKERFECISIMQDHSETDFKYEISISDKTNDCKFLLYCNHLRSKYREQEMELEKIIQN